MLLCLRVFFDEMHVFTFMFIQANHIEASTVLTHACRLRALPPKEAVSGDSIPDDGDDTTEINIPTMDEVIAARKKRELARSHDDFIPLDPKAPTEPTSVFDLFHFSLDFGSSLVF